VLVEMLRRFAESEIAPSLSTGMECGAMQLHWMCHDGWGHAVDGRLHTAEGAVGIKTAREAVSI
jgi:hypothetical protein